MAKGININPKYDGMISFSGLICVANPDKKNKPTTMRFIVRPSMLNIFFTTYGFLLWSNSFFFSSEERLS